MAELDLSLSDALTDSVPQQGPESLVERDFVAQLEAETFDDQVGETVGKTDYIPLLDNDDARAGFKLTGGGQTAALRPEPQGEVWSHSFDQQQAFSTDFLSASMASYSDPLGSQTGPAQMMDSGQMGVFSGFSQPGGMGINMEVEVGVAPLSADRIQSIAEPQDSTPPAGSNAPKEHTPMLPEPQAPRSPLELSAGASGDCWPNQAAQLSTDLTFTPSHHAKELGINPDDAPDGWPSRESTAYAGGDERDGDGSDRKQKKKKKRRQKEEASYEHPEGQAQGENIPTTEEFYHRIGPRRDRGEGGWEEQLGKSGGRGKKGRSRKKIPEEWGGTTEPFVPASAATSKISEDTMMDLGSSVQPNLETSFGDTSQSQWKAEVCPEEGLVPSPLSQDLFSAASINPMILKSELNATAAPFTMPSTANNATVGSLPVTSCPNDPFDLLMDSENASLGNSTQAFLPPLSLKHEAVGGDMVDSGMFDNTNSFQESCVQGLPEGDTSAFSPASQSSPGFSPKEEVLASAPPLSPSDASWLLNDSHMSSNSEAFDYSDISSTGHPLPLGMSFDTPSPAPLRSPKTTAQEFHPKEHQDGKLSEKLSKKSHSSSSSSIKSPTSPGEKSFPPQASPVISPSSPPSVPPLAIPGSGLNPTAKPFFPSFADTFEEPATVPPVFPITEVKSDMMEKEKKEEKSEDSAKMVDLCDPLDKADQKSVKVEFISSDTPAKMEKEVEKEKQTETEKDTGKEVETVKEKEKQAEKVQEKDAEMLKETQTERSKEEKVKKETEKPAEKVEERKETEQEKEKVVVTVEPVHQKTDKDDRMNKEEESSAKSVKTDKVDRTEKEEKDLLGEKAESKVEKTENMEKVDKNEKPKVEESVKSSEKLENPEVKDDKEQHIESMIKTPEQQPTVVKPDAGLEKKADVDSKTAAEVEETKKEETDIIKVKKTEAEDEKPAEKPIQKSDKEEKADKLHAGKKAVDKKDETKDKAAKTDGGDKTKKAKPAVNGGSATPSKDLGSADKKTKPGAVPTKWTAATKTRPTSTAAAGTVSTKRPMLSSTTSASDKKPITTKAPPTTAATPKRPSTTTSSRPASSGTTAATRDVKARTTAEKRPLVPKASTTTSNQTGATKNGTATTVGSRTTTTVRTATTTRTSTTTAAKKPLASKTDNKPGEEKKPSTLRTSAADSTKPKSTTTRSAASTTAASRIRTAASKPATPSSTTGTVPEKKPPVPRATRVASSTTTSTTTSRTTTRPSTAPAPDIRNARSKIGSTDNMKHQPGGGKVSSASQSRVLASKETSQAKVQILNKKVDLSKVTSKCGSKDNIKHKPGGGVVKIESHKVSFREKAQSKVGSMDNVSHSPGGGNIKAEGAQETTEGNGTPLSGTAGLAQGSEPGPAGSPAAQENGVKEGVPSDSEALREPQALDSGIPETN